MSLVLSNTTDNIINIDNTGGVTITAIMSDGAGGAKNLTRAGAGAGILTLSGVNTYTGLTSVLAGTLAEGVSNAISTGGLTVNGSTAIFDLGASRTDTVGTVTLDGGGAINGTGNPLNEHGHF